MSEPWDKPSERLKRIASYKPLPMFRECGWCFHRHPQGERCGHYTFDGSETCACRR